MTQDRKREAALLAPKQTPAVTAAPKSGLHHRFVARAPALAPTSSWLRSVPPNAPATLLAPLSFLTEVSALLSASLEYIGALGDVTRVVATRFASGCVVDVAAGPVRRRIAYPPSLDEGVSSRALSFVVERACERATSISSRFDAVAHDAAIELGVDWLVAAPLRASGASLGVLTVFGGNHQPAPSLVDLEYLAARAASAIENGRLYETALAGIEMRDQALAMVAHDLKNPLAVVLMSAATLLERERPSADPTDRRKIDAIHRCALRMRTLVGDLLDFAALDGRRLTMRPGLCSSAEIVRDVFEMLAPLAGAAHVALVDEIPDDLPRIWADGERIAQVLCNIVGNSLKFTRGGGTITARAVVAGGSVRISIVDTGVGIAPTELAMVCERFWQGPNARLGSGLGLAICKGIIEHSRGRMSIDSELGVGTTISFELPIERPAKTLP